MPPSSVASGMPANGLALVIKGFAPASIPLTAILPQGAAGCSLWTTADLLDVSLPIAGTATAAIAIPNALGLVGRTFFQQVAALELDAAGGLLAVTTTNALAQIIGAL
jgi:hypothetical protein